MRVLVLLIALLVVSACQPVTVESPPEKLQLNGDKCFTYVKQHFAVDIALGATPIPDAKIREGCHWRITDGYVVAGYKPLGSLHIDNWR